jgi:UDP-GlcNAc:undecaprenyl-phosphate/decaprenyl-phosphate GlcNAc-1-phosphate transferase
MGITDIEYFALFLTTFLLVGALTPLARKVALSQKIVDNPTQSHKTHKEPIPYLGGVAIMVGIVAVSYGTSLIANFSRNTFALASSVLIPALILGLMGLWDDIRNLSPLPRFVAQTIAGVFTAFLLISSSTSGNPTGSQVIDTVITIIWIVGICNSINFFDNLDGGAAGTVAISSIALTILALGSGQSLIAALAVVTAGGTLGFLIWNKSPARIYMGDAGALFLGVLIAVLTIRLIPTTETLVGSFATPILVLAIPILDTTVAVLSRLRRGISPFQGGKDHLSHRLIRRGISRRVTAFILWVLSAVFGALAIWISRPNASYENWILVGAGALWAALFIYFFATDDE